MDLNESLVILTSFMKFHVCNSNTTSPLTNYFPKKQIGVTPTLFFITLIFITI